ncbi:MAG: DUF3570 domain-containing protein, partial [Flavobacteriaceae bacterium]
LNDDDVLTIDAGISAYTSASSSNLNPFDISGASNGEEDDDDEEEDNNNGSSAVIGTPWAASSGASRQDTWASFTADYSHSSDDRNFIWNTNLSFAAEYDYTSFGIGAGMAKLFNEKNTEISAHAKVYIDFWNPRYPTELDSYVEVNGNLNDGFFEGVDILDQNGNVSMDWQPVPGFSLIKDKGRNTYALTLAWSQIINRYAQFSLFVDIVQQQGWLGNPMQRVYFSDIDNYYIGNASSIPIYTSKENKDVFQLADDFERLPDTRFKYPIGFRFNYYLNEKTSLRTYYRFYNDDWGIISHTASVEIPFKITSKFTLYPSYRYYNQTEANYFAPYEENLSTSSYYTSDYDLSEFNANQYGIGLSYTDIFTNSHIWKLGLKNIDFKYNYYKRNTGLSANYFAIAFKFLVN